MGVVYDYYFDTTREVLQTNRQGLIYFLKSHFVVIMRALSCGVNNWAAYGAINEVWWQLLGPYPLQEIRRGIVKLFSTLHG